MDEAAPTADVVLASIRKNDREFVRVAVRTFKGRRFLDARVFTPNDRAEGGFSPTAKGLTLSRPDHIDQLTEALIKAKAALESDQ